MGTNRKVMLYIHKERMFCNSINNQIWRNNRNLFLIQRNKVVFFAENAIICNGPDSTFVKLTYVSLLPHALLTIWTVNKFSKTGNQVESLRRPLPIHSLLRVYVRNCKVIVVVY